MQQLNMRTQIVMTWMSEKIVFVRCEGGEGGGNLVMKEIIWFDAFELVRKSGEK